ncbi:ribosome maturation factor RimP [Mycolicibacterium mengxianglii]|uniref:ribosome maturation factor RimP n=1 Tax=Mycolicibacterium mengxianglii TaxID=2736649 RepID=UPI0018D16B8D|nr:ribosome maturation factor RimP [Mycolicibacterium mengxianglii]
MTERFRGLPSPQQVIELLDDEFTRAGFEIEDVRVNAGARPARIAITVDGDNPLDLDAVAELSRIASQLLDTLPDSEAYVLEVGSPGVDRPLVTEKHFRRAQGRKVELTLGDGTELTARIAGFENGVLRLVVPGRKGTATFSVREVPLTEITKAVVQVDFSPPSQRELDLVSQSGAAAGADGTEAGA